MNENTATPEVKGHIDGNVIEVHCPYCGQVHRHGYHTEAYPAHRVSHCHLEKAALGYIVVAT